MDEKPITLQKVLLIYNRNKENALAAAHRAQSILNDAGIQTRACTNQEETALLQEYAMESDAIVALGGDGTILGVVRQLADFPRPLFGINLGGFGFLTSCARHELDEALYCLVEKRWQIYNRHLLDIRVFRQTEEGFREVFYSQALNEGLLTRSQPGRLMELWLGEKRESSLSYRADGLIVATATGSTGHSLSAGGPILEPNLAALVVTPVSPHSLFNRPLVYSGEKELHVWFHDGAEELILIIDGQVRTNLHASDRIDFRRSKKTFPTISMPGRSFSEVLRYKFNLRGTP